VVSPPTKTQFGWHLIEAEGPVMPKGTRPLDKSLKAQIRSQLVQKQRQKHIAQQFNAAEIELSKDIQFAPGYAPAVATTQ
jgi:parvulin-like peptidyl-prolyl isomerase